ncbi:MAG: hypothetical protein U1F16_10095 [Turneriella sp.]
MAREVARELPDLIHKVVALGTPVVGGPKYTAVAKLYARWGFDLDAMARDVADRNAVTIDREILAIYSKGDNIVEMQRACIDNQSPRIRHEVQGSHLGLVVNARAFGLTRDFLCSVISARRAFLGSLGGSVKLEQGVIFALHAV